MEKVYYTFIEFDNESLDYSTFSLCRKEYLDSISDKKRKTQSFYAWKLLLYALKNFSYRVNLDFYRVGDKFFLKDEQVKFSITHSNRMVAVIVSQDNCGIDAELVSDKILKIESKLIEDSQEKMFNKLNPEEKKDVLTRLWTENEAIFKSGGVRKINFTEVFLNENSEKYILAYTGKSLPIKVDISEIMEV